MTSDTPTNRPSGTLTLPLGWLAVAATLAAVGLATGLVVVGTVRNVDSLSTIALVLAILAFVVQLMVFITQTWQSQTVYAETRSLLARLEATTSGVHTVVSEQNKEFMRQNQAFADYLMHELPKQYGTSSKADEGGTLDPSPTRADLERIVANAPSFAPVQPRAVPEPFKPSPADQTIIDELTSFPDKEEDARPALDIIEKLSPFVGALLERFGRDELNSRRLGGQPGLGRAKDSSNSLTDVLVREGLVAEAPVPAQWTDTFGHWHMLTDKGRSAARLLIASGNTPLYIVRRVRKAHGLGGES